jgi:hypothetical protein
VSSKLTVTDLLEKVENRFGLVRELDEPEGLDQLVLLFLARRLPFKKARGVLRRLKTDFVDWNDVRVTPPCELAEVFDGVGGVDAYAIATELGDLLSTLYLRFNKMTVDLRKAPNAAPEEVKRAQKTAAFLLERSSLYAALMTTYAGDHDDVVASPDASRVAARLGFVPARASDASVREALLKRSKSGERVGLQFALHLLAERVCHKATPLCDECPVLDACPSAKPAEKAPPEKAKKAPKARKPSAAPKKAARPKKARGKA